MDRRRLECFVMLAEDLHFGRAAQRAGISQPGLSQQLRQLEELLQVRLVHRSKRQVSLTRAGEVFLDEARKIIAGMAAAVELTRRTDDGLVGTLKLGATPSALFIAMPEIVHRFRASFPQVDIDMRQLSTDEQITALRSGDIHVGLLHPPAPDSALESHTLVERPFKVAMSTANPLSLKPSLTLADLAEQTFIMFSRGVGPQNYDDIISRCRHLGFSPRKIIELSPAQSIVAAAACDFGVGFVAFDVQHHVRPLVTYRSLSGGAPVLRIAAAHPRVGATATALQFVAVAQQALAEGPGVDHESQSDDTVK